MLQYKYIWKYSDDCYVMYASNNTEENSCSYTPNSKQFSEVKQYYNNHPEFHIDGSKFNPEAKLIKWFETNVYPLQQELLQLEEWFMTYDMQVLQYNRSVRLNTPYDDKYGTIEELDTQAALNSQRISELRKQIEEAKKNKPKF